MIPVDPNMAKAPGLTTLLHFDHMNDYRGYTKLLNKWTKQLKLGGAIFLSLHCKPRPRHIFAVLDAPNGGTSEFLHRLRTQNVDVNMRGQPCKERMSTVVVDFPLLPETPSTIGELQVVETEGSGASKSHILFCREWLRANRLEDAEELIAAMDKHLEEHSNKSKNQKKNRAKGGRPKRGPKE